MNKTCQSLNCYELAVITGGKKKKSNWKKVGRCTLGVLFGAASGATSGPIGIIGGTAVGIASACL